jgi:septal ring factor EnvC (AmiA/AmiB activator)
MSEIKRYVVTCNAKGIEEHEHGGWVLHSDYEEAQDRAEKAEAENERLKNDIEAINRHLAEAQKDKELYRGWLEKEIAKTKTKKTEAEVEKCKSGEYCLCQFCSKACPFGHKKAGGDDE